MQPALRKSTPGSSQSAAIKYRGCVGVRASPPTYWSLNRPGYVAHSTKRANGRLDPSSAYLLTPSGIEAKARLTVAFLHRKVAE